MKTSAHTAWTLNWKYFGQFVWGKFSIYFHFLKLTLTFVYFRALFIVKVWLGHGIFHIITIKSWWKIKMLIWYKVKSKSHKCNIKFHWNVISMVTNKILFYTESFNILIFYTSEKRPVCLTPRYKALCRGWDVTGQEFTWYFEIATW